MRNQVNKRDITKGDVWQMFSMLDWCYHRGVEDAYKSDDMVLVAEYLNREPDATDWAMLGQDYKVGWQEYLLMLIHRAARTNWKGYMRRYFDSIRRYGSSYLSCFIPITLLWYKRGLEDYMNNPDACDFNVFMSRTRVYWTSQGIRSVKSQHYVEDVQYATFQFERRDEEIWENNTESASHRMGAMNPMYYRTFRQIVKLCATYKKSWF